MKKLLLLITVLLPALASAFEAKGADMLEDVYREDWVVDTVAPKELRLNINSLLFFRNNEFSTHSMVGYTLPGFRLRPSLSYKPSAAVRLDLGVYALRYWGTDHYPNIAYSDIAFWNGTGKANRGFHLVPFLRARMSTPFGLTIVMGSLYGGSAHKLIEPMYAPELNLSADPEAGLQLLYENPRLNLDAWINWESFIYRGDTHQEAFMVGVSGMVKYTRLSSKIQVYSPVAMLIQHRGGEIDTLYHNATQSLFNASVGIGASIETQCRWLSKASLQADFLVHRQMTGDLWPYDHGKAWFLHADARVWNVDIRAGYFSSRKFIPLMGYPVFGSLASTPSADRFGNTSTFMAGARYALEFSPGYTLGVDVDYYRQPRLHSILPATGAERTHKPSNSFSFGVYMRLTPSFLLRAHPTKNVNAGAVDFRGNFGL